jgi:hypothetical protein
LVVEDCLSLSFERNAPKSRNPWWTSFSLDGHSEAVAAHAILANHLRAILRSYFADATPMFRCECFQ